MELVVNDKGTIIKIIGDVEGDVVLPASAVRITRNLFSGNNDLKQIIMSNNLKYIGEKAFYNCINLENVIMQSVEQIYSNAFFGCKNLKEISFSPSLLEIDNGAFMGCEKLKKISLPTSIKEIASYAFNGCKSIEEIDVPSGIIKINERTFSECQSLRSVKLAPSVAIIDNYAFYGCSSLEKIEFPTNLVLLKKGSFERCINLREVVLNENIRDLEAGCFAYCYNLDKVVVKNYSNIKTGGLGSLNSFEYYLDKETDDVIMSKSELIDENRYRKLDYESIYNILGETNKFNAIKISIMFEKEQLDDKEIKPILYIIKEISLEDINKYNYNQIAKSLYNSKEFTNLTKYIKFIFDDIGDSEYEKMVKTYKLYNIFKFAYSVGAFDENVINRQKACEFIKNLFDKKVFDKYNIVRILNNFKFKQYDKNFADFIMTSNNLEQLINESNGFLTIVSNSFEEIREFGRSNKGEQKYRKVTVEMCVNYCKTNNFQNVSPDNKDIANILKRYTVNQTTFDEAANIRAQYLKLAKEGRIEEHILGKAIKESDAFEQIENIRNDIVSSIGGVLNDINYVANQEFNYEFLSKYDPDNFVLGKYCSCCSHLESTGYGIVKASILHPDCQNLVIRNKHGKIIAKSTIYVNRKQGYAVFNNVEVNTIIKDVKKKKMIYDTYIKAVERFVKEYNLIYTDNPITQVNVGMANNDLQELIEVYNEKETSLLEGLNFTSFGKVNQLHSGDWLHNQRILYKQEKANTKK